MNNPIKKIQVCFYIVIQTFFLFILHAIFLPSLCLSEYLLPFKIVPIEKSQASYATPEDAFTAKISALLHHDLEWYYDSLTIETAVKDKQLFQEAGIDPERKFDLVSYSDDIFIIKKINYKNGVLLVARTQTKEGYLMQGAATLVLENGFWKTTSKFAYDDELAQYDRVVPPLFYGKGQKPKDVNSFLGYVQPTQVQTELITGSTNSIIDIYYGETVDSATFTAELNKQDITSQFSPKPFTDEEVEIPLQKGRNTLVLSIEGTRKDGKKARDTDRLVFIVP
jgi:hypothetical protein